MAVSDAAMQSPLVEHRARLHASVWKRSVGLSAVAGLLLAWLLHPHLPLPALAAWLAALALVLGARAGVGQLQRREHAAAGPASAEQRAERARTWLRRHRIAFALHGLVWAALAWLMLGRLPHEAQDVAVIALTSLCAGSMIATAFDMRAAALFCVAPSAGLLLNLFGGDAHGQAVGTMVSMFLVTSWFGAQRAQALMGESVAAREAERAQVDRARAAAEQAARAQAALADQHRLFTELVRGTDEGFWFIDTEGRTIDANPAMCRLLGRPLEAVLGHSVFEFFEGEDLQILRREIAARQAGAARGAYELGITRPDGTRRHCLNQATALHDAQGRRVGSVGIWTDISERLEMEELLREHVHVTNSISDMVAVVDAGRRYVMVNDAWCRVVGVTREQALGRSMHELMGAEVNPERERAFQACVAQGESRTVCNLVVLRHAPARLIETTYTRYHHRRDARPGVVMVSRDVGEREQARAELEIRAEYLRRTLGATGDAIFASEDMDLDAPVRFHNEQMLQMWGIRLAPGEALSSRIIMRHAAPLLAGGEAEVERIRAIVASDQPHEARVPLTDGRMLLRRSTPARVAGRPMRVWSFRDITVEVQAMQALQRAEAEERALLEAFPGHIACLSDELAYTYVNRSLAALLGAAPEAIVGRRLEDVLGPERAARLLPLARRTLAGETVTFEHRHRDLDGRPGPHSQVTLTPGRDSRSGRRMIYGFAIDITDRKRAEEALIAARDEAERANAAKTQFLSQMSHELRTPMNAIIGFGQLLHSDEAPALAPHQQGWTREILRGAEHLLELINEVLDLGRIEAGQLLLHTTEVPLAPLADEVLALAGPLAARHGVALQPLQGPWSLAVVRADRTRLKQVLLNLVANAIKYNRPRGGHVSLICVDEGRQLRLAVQDNGPGIAEADLRRLFQPFERLGAERSGIEGTGIGLALCRRLADAMGGELGVDSEPGFGSTFWLRLPAAQAAAGDGGPAGPGEPGALPAPGAADAARLVLYVEDNPVNVALMEAMLARLPDVRLVSVSAPMEGLRLARELKPGLILLDIQLPGLDGFEVLARLRAQADTASIPVVAVSANALPSDVDTAMAAGFSAYLTKPLALERLLSTVRKALQPA